LLSCYLKKESKKESRNTVVCFPVLSKKKANLLSCYPKKESKSALEIIRISDHLRN